MKLLFIDHECHRKTRSADFFVDLLKRAFEVTVHAYSRYYRTGAAAVMAMQDVAVIWEFPVSRRKFFFPGKRNVFVPMYDNEWGSYWQWKRIAWSGMGVISFCGAVTRHARRCGVRNILELKYFPPLEGLPREVGDPKRVFLWERGDISRRVAETLFPPSEGYVFDVKGAKEFLPREEYLQRLAKCGIVIAPRRKEGIGMAFLETMAMGKCVAAHDDATMNEYIEDGVNGILFDATAPQPVSLEKLRRVWPSSAVEDFRYRWLVDLEKINDFISSQPICRPSFTNRLKLFLSYPLYFAEGAVYRMRHG